MHPDNSRIRFGASLLLLFTVFVLCGLAALAQAAKRGKAAVRESPTKKASPLFPVQKHGKWGFIDNTGKMVVPLQYDLVLGFNEGLALVRVGEKWGFIDKTGQVVIPPRYDFPDLFSEGLAAVKIGHKFGFIDKTGKMVVPPQYDFAWGFLEGLASVMVGEKSGYIDKAGKYVWKPTK